jgi:hypothetical protein
MATYREDELALLAAAREVVIETRSGSRAYRTVVWVAVDGDDVFLRSVRGESGRWYQRVLVDPAVALDAGGTRIEGRVVPAADAVSLEQASSGFRRKYPKSGSLDAMLAPAVLDTTLRLEPPG